MPQERIHPVTRSAHAALILVVLAIAAWLRLAGYNAVPLWLDEAWRANLILDDGWLKRLADGSTTSAVTSLVYAAFVHGLGVLYDTEWVLRLSSLIPGTIAVLLFVPIVKHATGSATFGYVAALVAATQPMLLGYAKELKPYSFELCAHLLLLLIALAYIAAIREDRSRSAWTWGIAIAGPVASVSAANLVFLLPGWYLAIFYTCYRSFRRIPTIFISSAAVSALLVFFQYKYVWSHAAKDAGLIEFWKDGFFGGGGSHIGWILSRVGDTIESAFESSRELPSAIIIALQALAAIGLLGFFSSRSLHIFLLIVSPVLSLIAANMLHIWPLGPFRVNAFLYGYLILIVCTGCTIVIRLVGTRFLFAPRLLCVGFAAAFLWFWIPALPGIVARSAHLHATHEDVPAALMSLAHALGPNCNERSLVLVNVAASHAVAYYTKHNTHYSQLLSSTLGRCANLEPTIEAYVDRQGYEEALRKKLARRDIAWFVYSHLSQDDIAAQKSVARKFGRIDSEHSFTGAGIFRLTIGRNKFS